MSAWWWALIGIGAFLVLVAIYDVLQRRHTILRVFPIIGHLRYILEAFGPEVRQYIVTNNDEERPFSRNQRRWIYASSKHQNNAFGFGTEAEFERSPGYLIISPSAFPAPPAAGGDPDDWPLPSAKVLGGPRERPGAFRPASVVNISGMSFGALSARAVESLNAGAALAGCMQTTGEGGLTPYHLQGGDLVMQFGTGWYGARDSRGRLDLPILVDLVQGNPIRAIEIKMSQGAKPGLGGMLPGSKVTPEIAAIRGVEPGKPCVSPSVNPEFGSVDELLDLVERIADATGLPVGIKSAVGDPRFWSDLARHMDGGSRGVDFITIDGGEGGTGSGPLSFIDHVGLPYRLAQARALRAFAERGIQHRVTWIGSGRLGLPEESIMAFALGADMINVGREAMLSIGCIQAQRCHTGRCPSGVATQSAWRQRGIDPTLKSARAAAYIITMRREITRLARATGVEHPAQVNLDHIEVLEGDVLTPVSQRFGITPDWAVPVEI
ncbi:MAG: FMN-binding glutamate synthase family protein [Actinobacteria bacterium]|nr:FMN-binding glutamate synthase family protein [Actinomycetota bacterium]